MAACPGSTEHYGSHPSAFGCRSLPTGPFASPGHERSPSEERKEALHAAAGFRKESNALATRDRAGLVRRRRSEDCLLPPHGGVASHRLASGTDPLGADPGPATALRPASPTVYGSHPGHPRYRVLVRAALAGGGDLSGSTKNSRGGNPATVEPSGGRANHAVLARSVFSGNVARRSTRALRYPAAATGCLVHQATSDVYRCAGRRAPALLEVSGFSRVRAQRPDRKSSPSFAGVPGLCSVPRCLMAKVELSIRAGPHTQLLGQAGTGFTAQREPQYLQRLC